MATLYTYPNCWRTNAVLIAAKYGGVELKVVSVPQFETSTGGTESFLKKFPLKKLPVFEGEDGFYIYGSNAIAHYVGSDSLRGSSLKDSALIQQWMSYADNEVLPAAATWVYPTLGRTVYNKQTAERAKEVVRQVLTVLDEHLRDRTFLVGECITLADITMACALLWPYKQVLEPSFREPYIHVNQWFITCMTQPAFVEVLGDVKLCEKASEYRVGEIKLLKAAMQKDEQKVAEEMVAVSKEEVAGQVDSATEEQKEVAPAIKEQAQEMVAVSGEQKEVVSQVDPTTEEQKEVVAVSKEVADQVDLATKEQEEVAPATQEEVAEMVVSEEQKVESQVDPATEEQKVVEEIVAVSKEQEEVASQVDPATEEQKEVVAVSEEQKVDLATEQKEVVAVSKEEVAGQVAPATEEQKEVAEMVAVSEEPKEVDPTTREQKEVAEIVEGKMGTISKKQKKVVEEMDATELALKEEPKAKDPFAFLPKSSFVLDEFKRKYSNEDTLTVALPYLWEHFDKEGWSIWYGEHKYPGELNQIFMSCNLITGMFQRLDSLRKNAFASVILFGGDGDSCISGVWILRGQQLAFEMCDDWKMDYESYSWRKLDPDSEECKTTVKEYFTWEGAFMHAGKPFNQGKIFK
ncbi:elongation factor 1-gamma-A [Latimeria chalumnae]|uniref:elongation factor 1-gamma-A n=1 Tax=Latimeria chalumnae TaxID=7897 RepID=UPI0003C10042|nr:PREDICTED: elongation factor 1-gamma-A-like [Latimeria chalumnae]|eukprot:XP_005991676.1 PREDICTED: elongation factor 1-gamma-A-like [Latimeria chalumnae]